MNEEIKKECVNERLGTWNLESVFKQNLVIPEFQRPYSWNKEQVEQLIEDLLEAYDKGKLYLIGNMILYEDKEELKIIDGQQRVTTLALLLKVLNKETDFLSNKINPLSIKKLKTNYEIIKNYFDNFNKDDFLDFLLKKVLITYIKTNSLDEAFVLFDSQNTRGKPLKRKDILKVHHIHPIKKDRKLYAKRWEEWEKFDGDKYWDRLDEVLYYISFVRRGIRNEVNTDDFDFIDVFKELKTQSSNYKLNNYNQPPIYEDFEFDFENNEIIFITKPIRYKSNKILDGIKYLPFELNSSIVGGEKFFMYVWKYFNLYNSLLEFECFKKLDNVYGGNRYLKVIYKALLLFYYDKFAEKLDEFAKRVYILLLYFRLIKKSVRKDGVKNFIINDFNIFDLILKNYSIEDVFKVLDKHIKFDLNKEILEEKLKEISGVTSNFLVYDPNEILKFVGDLK